MRKRELVKNLATSGFSTQPGAVWYAGGNKICCLWWGSLVKTNTWLRISHGKNYGIKNVIRLNNTITPPYKRSTK